MNADEKEILDFLRPFKELYVSVTEVSRRLSVRNKFRYDRAWARPLLLRLEMEGVLESNEFGEFRLRDRKGDTNFKDALMSADPTVSLGETTIIRLKDGEDYSHDTQSWKLDNS